MKPMKIYLAGPMRGIPLYNFPAFDAEAARLRALGHTVFSPAERDRQDGFNEKKDVAKTIDYYMSIDLPEVCCADAIVVLPGWQKSQGANIEVAVGLEVGKRLFEAGTMNELFLGGTLMLPHIKKVTPEKGTAAQAIAASPERVVESLPGYPKHAGAPHPLPVTDDSNPKDLLGLKKVPLRLVPPALIIFVSKVMGLGAKKYGPYNWRDKKIRHSVYLEAALRHILSAMDGEDADPESGMPHEAHAAACMGIILDAKSLDGLINDRPRPGAAAQLIAGMTEKS